MHYKKWLLSSGQKGGNKNIGKEKEKLSLFADRMSYMGNLRQSMEMPLEIKNDFSKVAIHIMNESNTNHATSR